MTRRHEQITAMLTRAVQQVVTQGLSDPRVRGLITVTEVTVSPDLAEARVSVSVLPESSQELTLHGLQAAAAHLRRQVGDLVDMKRTPQLIFRADNRLKREAAVLKAINLAAEDQRRKDSPETGWTSVAGKDGADAGRRETDGQQSPPGKDHRKSQEKGQGA